MQFNEGIEFEKLCNSRHLKAVLASLEAKRFSQKISFSLSN